MARKTIAVAELRDVANTYLEASGPEQSENRQGVIGLLEYVLHQTGNYHGFSYRESEYLPEPERDYRNGHVLRPGYDETRRVYH